MIIDEDFNLEYGQRLILKKSSGYSVIEFCRHPDKDLDNVIEVWKYDSRKKPKPDSYWITQKSLPDFIKNHREEYTTSDLIWETKKSKKK